MNHDVATKLELTESGKILGINRRSYPGPGTDWVRTEIIVVLVSGAIGDYAAYIACGDDPELAKHHGDKLSFEEAQIHFCNQLQKERYRD